MSWTWVCLRGNISGAGQPSAKTLRQEGPSLHAPNTWNKAYASRYPRAANHWPKWNNKKEAFYSFHSLGFLVVPTDCCNWWAIRVHTSSGFHLGGWNLHLQGRREIGVSLAFLASLSPLGSPESRPWAKDAGAFAGKWSQETQSKSKKWTWEGKKA